MARSALLALRPLSSQSGQTMPVEPETHRDGADARDHAGEAELRSYLLGLRCLLLVGPIVVLRGRVSMLARRVPPSAANALAVSLASLGLLRFDDRRQVD